MTKNNIHIPDSFHIQWHITDQCNLRCKHCYIESHQKESELEFIELLKIFNQYKDFLEFCNSKPESPFLRGSLSITGGEPFIRTDFMEFLEIICSNIPYLEVFILTNGTMIDKNTAKRLKELKVDAVQVSIDGSESVHDSIRGSGSYKKAVQGLKYLVEEGLLTSISFTADKNNYKEFTSVAKLGQEIGVSSVWSDRAVPIGNGKNLMCLSPEETFEYCKIMHEARTDVTRSYFNQTVIGMYRSLQFLVGGGDPYICIAGNNGLTILPNGDVYPCRRLPIKAGNLTETTIYEIFYENELFKELRKPDLNIEGCEGCLHINSCKGGAKCITYALTGSLHTADPGCWHTPKNF